MDDRTQRRTLAALRQMVEAVMDDFVEGRRTEDGCYLVLPRGYSPTESQVEEVLQRGQTFKLRYAAPSICGPAQFFLYWSDIISH